MKDEGECVRVVVSAMREIMMRNVILRVAVLMVCAALPVVFSGWTGAMDAALRIAQPREYDRPGEADRFFYQQRVFPTGEAPAEWREEAERHIRGMRPASMAKTREQWSWTSLGPANIAGRIRAMAMDPVNANILYAGAAGGGVWKSTNGGVGWRALGDFMPNLRIGSIAVHPANPSTVLAGCGEGFVLWQDALAYGRGIYRSDNAGETWSLIPATASSNFEFVFDIAFDPFNPDIILAGTRVGIMRSTDAGATWTKLNIMFSQIRGMMSVFSRTTEGLVYSALESNGIFRSTDHGATWAGPLRKGIDATMYTRIQLAAAPSNGDVVYAAFTSYDESCAGVYKSTDRGENWSTLPVPQDEVEGGDYMREQGQYNSVLTVHPSNPSIVWAGGINLHRSTNGGSTWRQMSNWYPFAGYQYVHADMHAFVFNPANPNSLVVGCDGGVYRSTNGGSIFLDSNTGLVTTQFHSGTPHPSSDVVLGGTIDNGNLRVSSGTSWFDVTGGDGGYTAVDYKDPRVMYAEIYYLAFYKSTSSGAGGTFVSKMNGIPTDPGGDGTTDRCAFIAPFQMDPTDPKTLYAGTFRLYRTTNAAELWTAISPDISGGGYITAIGISKSQPSVVYTGASTGVAQVTTNGGSTWMRISAGLPSRYITDIAVDPSDPATAYLTVSGFKSGHVFRTTNGGQMWTDASGSGASSLPDAPVNSVALHPVNGRRLYVGTDVGCFMSDDAGDTWYSVNGGMGNVTVADLQFRLDGTLFAATHGRGMYKSSYSLLDTQKLPSATEYTLHDLYPNPANGTVTPSVIISYNIRKETNVVLEMFDLTGRKINTERFGLQTPGDYRRSIDLRKLPAGMYFYSLMFDNQSTDTRKFLLLR